MFSKFYTDENYDDSKVELGIMKPDHMKLFAEIAKRHGYTSTTYFDRADKERLVVYYSKGQSKDLSPVWREFEKAKAELTET